MVLGQISLKNFRLHQLTEIDFSGGLNYIAGGNGQGKTSLLEAIYYLCTSKSFLSAEDSQAVRFGESYFRISGLLQDLSQSRVELTYDLSDGKKSVLLDSKRVGRASALISRFPVVTLTARDRAVTEGAPSERRRLFDMILSQSDSGYLSLLQEYNRILRQRSSLLNLCKESGNHLAELDVWSDRLVQSGTEIVRKRRLFLTGFNDFLKSSYSVIMNDREIPSVEYLSFAKSDDVELEFMDQLKRLRSQELIRGTNLVGPQRDDFNFSINGFGLRAYGSQGQHKTFQVALKFAQFFFLKDLLKKSPLFLMDDIFGELDKKRAGNISDFLGGLSQAFITLTDLTSFGALSRPKDSKLIKMEMGVPVYA